MFLPLPLPVKGRLLSSVLMIFVSVFVSVWSIMPAYAQNWSIDVDPVCCVQRYKVYGSEQPVKGNNGTCSVVVGADEPDASAMDVWANHREEYHDFLTKEYGKVVSEVIKARSQQQWEEFHPKTATCNEKNLASSCIAERLLCSFEKYQGVMYETVNDQDLGPILDSGGMGSLSSSLREHADQRKPVLEEAFYTREAFDTALSLYHQMFKYYRLHLFFKDIIQAFSKARNWTQYLSKLVGCFPSKFLGSATTKCN